jgi:hypothetical protein
MQPDIVSRIKAAAKTAAVDPTLLPVLAAAFRVGEEFVPSQVTLDIFHNWLAREVAMIPAELVWVDRVVPLTEAVDALTRPVLPGEVRRMPVSVIGNDPVHGLMTARQNIAFRAVHDAMHAKLGADDSWEGELAVTLGHLMTSPPQIWPILASEVAGQAAVAIFEGAFPEQRLSGACLPMLCQLIEQVI